MIIAMTIIICITLIIITFLYMVANNGLDLSDFTDAVREATRVLKAQKEIADKMDEIGEEQYRQKFYDALKTYQIYGYDPEIGMVRLFKSNKEKYVAYIKLDDVIKCMGKENSNDS